MVAISPASLRTRIAASSGARSCWTLGASTPIRLTPDAGYFWFFDPTNIEIVTKVLGACAVNGNYWVFAAGLTNVEVTLNVLDTSNGESEQYFNQLNTAFQPIQDTAAFATCP